MAQKIVITRGNKRYVLEAFKPVKSFRYNKKMMVYVIKGNKSKIVHFGDPRYKDYTEHKDKVRRKAYLKRSAGIKDKSGKLTKGDVFSPNYWSRKILWKS